MIRCRLLLSPNCFSALNHFWSPSAQQVCLECSFWLCTCPENNLCLVMLHYHFIAWRMCRSQRVQESVLELLEFCIWWVLRWGGRRARFTSIWFTELLFAGSHNNIHWWIENVQTHLTIGTEAIGDISLNFWTVRVSFCSAGQFIQIRLMISFVCCFGLGPSWSLHQLPLLFYLFIYFWQQ